MSHGFERAKRRRAARLMAKGGGVPPPPEPPPGVSPEVAAAQAEWADLSPGRRALRLRMAAAREARRTAGRAVDRFRTGLLAEGDAVRHDPRSVGHGADKTRPLIEGLDDPTKPF